MKQLSFFIAIALITALVTMLAIEDPGYVLITRPPWSLEMSLSLFAFLLVLGAAILFLLIFLGIRAWLIPRKVSHWRLSKKSRKARDTLGQGLIRLTEGNWREAESQLASGAHYSETPLLNYLGAAYAAQQQGDNEKREQYLSEAHKISPESNFAISMTQARLQHIARQYEQELATLTELKKQKPHHRDVLKQLIKVYVGLHDWTSLAGLIPELRKHRVLEESEIVDLELQLHRELLMPSLPSGSLEVLKRAWEAVPRALKKHPTLVAIYATQLIAQNQMDEARTVLSAAIERQWDNRLIALFGQVRSGNIAAQLEQAARWLEDHSTNAVLLLTLGRLASEIGQLEKARAYLDKAAGLEDNAEIYQEIGKILEKQGKLTQAVEYYRRGLDTCAEGRP